MEITEKIKKLNEIWENIDFIECNDAYHMALDIANDCLISGSCPNYENISIFRKYGYSVYPGERDSFGWLTGVLQKKSDDNEDHLIVFG